MPPHPSTLPDPAQWQSPVAWRGNPLRPVPDYARGYPADAAFVRGEVRYTLSEPIGPGMTRQTERVVPALLALEKEKLTAFHAPGPDGRCWTFQRTKRGRKVVWECFAGDTWPATEACDPAGIPGGAVEYLYVHSVVPNEHTWKGISYMIRDDGTAEDFTRATDPDPND